MIPLRDDGVTIRKSGRSTQCSMCGVWFSARGRQRWCSAACRQTAFRRRLQLPLGTPPAMLRRVGRRPANTVYTCPQCEVRTLGTQQCDECHRFGLRVGWGGLCPHCEEPVALVDLAPELAPLVEGKP